MAIDYSALKFSKGVPRVVTRKKKVRDEKLTEQQAKNQVWKRAAGQCEHCGRHVKRGASDSLDAGHCHHKTYRSHGGTWDVNNLEVLCGPCHMGVHAKRIR